MLNLQWVKCSNGANWCPLESVGLSRVNTNGVYIIWYGGQAPAIVRVGQGDIASRLSAHRSDPQILAYRQFGLFVTWAAVSAAQRDGVERYLATLLKPRVGEAYPEVPPIAVNAPW
jgi:hypothetical protein